MNRYKMVTKDRQFPLSTPLSTVSTVISIWILTTLISCPPLLGWGEFSTNSLGVRYVYLLLVDSINEKISSQI